MTSITYTKSDENSCFRSADSPPIVQKWLILFLRPSLQNGVTQNLEALNESVKEHALA